MRYLAQLAASLAMLLVAVAAEAQQGPPPNRVGAPAAKTQVSAARVSPL